MRTPTFIDIPAAAGGGVFYTERGGREGVILVTYINPPTFHAMVVWPGRTTRCGKPAWWNNADGSRSGTRGIWLPLRWLVKFGRPCARCWP